MSVVTNFFSKLDLSSLESWSEADQQKEVNLLKDYHHLFKLDDLELGCTSQVKHKIRGDGFQYHLNKDTTGSL